MRWASRSLRCSSSSALRSVAVSLTPHTKQVVLAISFRYSCGYNYCSPAAPGDYPKEALMTPLPPPPPAVPAGSWTVDPSHSKVGFAVKHMGIATVRGEFKDFEGVLEISNDLS